MQSLDKDVRVWDVYVGLDCAVKDLLTALRAVTQLQNSAMRERHWAQLATAMKVINYRNRCIKILKVIVNNS